MMNLKDFRLIGKKIVCVGRNYRDHAAELNNPVPSKPLLFAKTTNAYVTENDGKIQIPDGCENLHFEVELGVVISKTAKRITKESAYNYIGGYTIALDMTARDIQDELKKAGHPWFLAKSFDTSCPIGQFVGTNVISDPHAVEIFCKLNGSDRQRSKTDAMIFDVPTLLEYVTRFCTLDTGDLVLTGTPAGVGQCKSGDQLEIGITGITEAKFQVL
ncbi:fumarylacetoacetate (FAA) hydrolase family domain-containing protein [Ditylenchus destructor]|uniref:Oxaloacetate tautomerase FAHD1, mitochondrial n=1 Tax=Ditylenchus destructor TaxID=166010 RepID=A0AAD4R9B7_9BILA|nr:fumarylacetoacetate (FAA) hydrolase family domain-containing protein [Ditylenchus destructor]